MVDIAKTVTQILINGSLLLSENRINNLNSQLLKLLELQYAYHEHEKEAMIKMAVVLTQKGILNTENTKVIMIAMRGENVI